MYGDDFAYKQFTARDINDFINRHITHYFLANGRFFVHMLVTIFLALPRIFWVIFNSLLLSCLVFFGARLVSDDEKKCCLPAVLIGSSIAFLRPEVTRQSVYWLTGSFNYVYPLAVFIIYWYLIDRPNYEGKAKYLMLMAAFFASASAEQVGMMTFGLTLLFILERILIIKQKPERVLYLALIISLIGILTIFLSPAVKYRASIEDAPARGFFALLKYNLKNQGTTFLFSKFMAPYNLFAVTSALYTIFINQRFIKPPILRRANQIILIFGITSFLCWLWQITSRNAKIDYEIIDLKHLLFYLFIGGGYLLILFYAAYLSLRIGKKGSAKPLILLILGFGSQLMMIVSPVYGPRNLLCCIFTLVLYSIALLTRFNGFYYLNFTALILCFLYDLPWLAVLPLTAIATRDFTKRQKPVSIHISKSSRFAAALAVIIFVSGITYTNTFKGYSDNFNIIENNLKVIEEYKANKSKGSLIQLKLADHLYGWVMPYHNGYYDPYYKLCYGLDSKTVIEWIDSSDRNISH